MAHFSIGRPGIQVFNPKRYAALLLLFLFVFPKGGFKVDGVPLTWGYLLLALLSLAALFGRRPLQVTKERLLTLLCLVPFQILSAMTMAMNGIINTGMVISFWVSFFILPYSFLFLFSQEIDELDTEWFFPALKKGMLFIAVYGIVLFLFRWRTGIFFEIPFLTTNLADLGLLDEKCNRRTEFIAKLISTYNNGNLYGVCLAMVLPLYCYLEKSISKQWIVKISFLLTLSRTVWIGLFTHELLFLLFLTKDKARALIKLAASCLALILLLFFAAVLIGFPISFFFDTRLGGRDVQFDNISEIGLFGSEPFFGILEIIYLGILHSFGWLGLAFFFIGVCCPLFFYRISHKVSPTNEALFIGLLNYLIMAVSDGGILYLPVMALYWFFLSLFFRR